jgi:TctA family transporter
LAEIAINFSSFEYFWLACLGLTCAVFLTNADPVKGFISLFIGLLLATVGIDPSAGFPRFTFGEVELMQGINFVAAMIGVFAVSELMRGAVSVRDAGQVVVAAGRRHVPRPRAGLASLLAELPARQRDRHGHRRAARRRRRHRRLDQLRRVQALLEGAGEVRQRACRGDRGCDLGQQLGDGGSLDSRAGLRHPGDSITAIVIGVLYMKGMNPGPTVFTENPQLIYAVFLIFILANLIMLPLGWAAIKSARQMLRTPRNVLLPVILLFCIVGSFAMTNSLYGVMLMLAMGVFGWFLEEHGIPVAPLILGLVLGEMLEQTFVQSMIKADGVLLAFFDRPIAGVLGVATLLIWTVMLGRMALRRGRPALA